MGRGLESTMSLWEARQMNASREGNMSLSGGYSLLMKRTADEIDFSGQSHLRLPLLLGFCHPYVILYMGWSYSSYLLGTWCT